MSNETVIIDPSEIKATDLTVGEDAQLKGMELDAEKPQFEEVSVEEMNDGKPQFRKVPIPPHRLTPLKKEWMKIYTPLVEHMKLQVRFNLKSKCVELRTSPETKDTGAIQKGADFVRAFSLGFEVDDAMALLRLDDLYIDSFEIKDVKTLHGDHLSRAIGRIAGRNGKTRFTIENASRTRIVVADTKIHILGSFQNIKVARDAVVSLILGSPPGKVYSNLRTVASRMRERF
ncbi:pre-rRNA-processing protein PNO1 [Paraphysoderma sedebokerense]|nr:pre-rRNA-processing protein PNO1 [Paraphysoderma sedebokerense]